MQIFVALPPICEAIVAAMDGGDDLASLSSVPLFN
jgi:hypothetical protein